MENKPEIKKGNEDRIVDIIKSEFPEFLRNLEKGFFEVEERRASIEEEISGEITHHEISEEVKRNLEIRMIKELRKFLDSLFEETMSKTRFGFGPVSYYWITIYERAIQKLKSQGRWFVPGMLFDLSVPDVDDLVSWYITSLEKVVQRLKYEYEV